MKSSFQSYLIGTLFALGVVLSACSDDDSFTASPNARLTINHDTVSLGTGIAGETTGTDTFKIYNKNSDAIRLSRVWLEGGAASCFKVNIDGQYLNGGEGGDFEIATKDSLIVFLMASLPDDDSDEIQRLTDRIHFKTEGGNEQSVVLKVESQSTINLKGLEITSDTTLTAARPFRILDSLVVAEGATLRLAAGTKLYFHPEANLIVKGKLISEGTVENNVVLRGDRLDNMLTQIPYDRIPNQWGGIIFRKTSSGNRLDYTDIHSGAFGILLDSCGIDEETLSLNGCVIHNTGGASLTSLCSKVSAINCQISNAAGDCLKIEGGDYSFIHCTIAQFYPLVGGNGVSLNFKNYNDYGPLPLEKLDFLNCIITGYNEDDIMGEPSERYTEAAFNYLFSNCLLNTPETDDESFIDCIFEKNSETKRDKNFVPEFNYDTLEFSFQLNPLSPAVGTANSEISSLYAPNDRLGIYRLSDNKPDMGCYQSKKE